MVVNNPDKNRFGPVPGAAKGGAWWKTALAMVIGSVLGAVAGAVAGVLLLIAAEALYQAGLLAERPPGADSTGMPIGIFVFGFFGALVGFLLGLAIPLLYHGWKLRMFGSVLGAVAGAVAGVLWLSYSGAVLGFLLGFAIPLIWHLWKLRTAARQSCKGLVEHSAEAGPLGQGSEASSPAK